MFHDEAYYWIYSQYPAWGYFDHPPMIAILIKTGFTLFQNEFGVRLLIVLLNTATIFLISVLIDNRNDKLFYAISASVAVAHLGGIIAVPDTPLLFFVIFYFLRYKKFVEKMNWLNSLWLAISIALMLYTKYHGVLVVFFTLLSNLKLLRRHQTYIVATVSLVLFAPHLYWQYTHDFPSVQFHLLERSASTYRFSFTTEYLLGQIILPGPIIGWLLIWAAIMYKSSTVTERALQFTLIGFYGFFLISSLNARVEANWTLPAFGGLIVLGHQYLQTRPGMSRWIYRTVPLTLLLVFAARIYMLLDGDDANAISKDEFHQNKVWVNEIEKKSRWVAGSFYKLVPTAF